MKANKLSGALAAAALFGLVSTVNADTGAANTHESVKTSTTTTTTKVAKNEAGTAAAESDAGKHDCKGHNSCKGNGGCKTGDNGCKGKNSCKGHGGCKTNG